MPEPQHLISLRIHLFSGNLPCNLLQRTPLQEQPENLLHRPLHPLVRVKPPFHIHIPIRDRPRRILSVPPVRPMRRPHLPGQILHIQLINHIFQRHHQLPTRLLRIIPVRHRNKPHAEKWEHPLNIIPRFHIIPSQPGQVLHNDTVNHPVPHIPHHRLKPRTLKIRTRAGDIRILLPYDHILPLRHELPQKLHLRLHRRPLPVRLRLLRKPGIQPRPITHRLHRNLRLRPGTTRQVIHIHKIHLLRLPRHAIPPPSTQTESGPGCRRPPHSPHVSAPPGPPCNSPRN